MEAATRPAGIAFALALAAILGAWGFQLFGFKPCELCLTQRIPYYAGVPLAALTFLAARSGAALPARLGLALLALLFIASAGLGAYHSGVEWGYWPGPAACTGGYDAAPSVGDLLRQIETTQIVRCDAVAIRIAGLSLAGWNVVVSLMIAVVTLLGSRQRRPDRASR